MYWFLVPLLVGFAFNSASAFTAFYSRHIGERGGRWVSILLRDVVGIPVWVTGYAMARSTPSTKFFDPIFISSSLAWFLILTGAVIIFVGLVSLSWRAVAPSTEDTLVVNGLYAHIRHPLYSGMILELAGLFLWVPTVNILIACLLGVVWAIFQTRLEELDLVERLPGYRDYMQRVPRFLPRLR